jgi:predicted nucleotide-binding protein (sugar kinase/HSP70/actin superfamily)
VLNVWSTHQFWLGFFQALKIPPNRIVFSSNTSEGQGREFGSGRGTVDCCYPVKCISGHYGELVFGQKRKIDVLFSPMVYSLPSFLGAAAMDALACPRVMAAPENIKAGVLKERDVFAESGIRYVAPLVALAEPRIVPKQLYAALRDVLAGLTYEETAEAVDQGYRTLAAFNAAMRKRARDVLSWCAPGRTGPASWCWRVPTTWTPASATRLKSTCRRSDIQSFGCSTSRPTAI